MKQQILIADIGGTNARFAVAEQGKTSHIMLKTATEYPSFEQALLSYMEDVNSNAAFQFQRAVFAVAGPVHHKRVDFTNSPWSIHADDTSELLECPVQLVNDFTAQAMVSQKSDLQLHSIVKAESSRQHEPVIELFIGPGTGLGVAYKVNDKIIATEAGHITLQSTSHEEFQLYQFLAEKYGHVSVERVCCGQGICDIHEFYTGLKLKAADINLKAHQKPDSAEAHSMQVFMKYFGSITGQLALATSANRIYLTGGIAAKVKSFYGNSAFIEGFCHKGRMSNLMKQKSIDLILEDHAALDGLALHFSL